MHMWSGGWVSKIPIVIRQTTQPKVIICTRCVTYAYHYMIHYCIITGTTWNISMTYGTDCSNILLHIWKRFDISYQTVITYKV